MNGLDYSIYDNNILVTNPNIHIEMVKNIEDVQNIIDAKVALKEDGEIPWRDVKKEWGNVRRQSLLDTFAFELREYFDVSFCYPFYAN